VGLIDDLPMRTVRTFSAFKFILSNSGGGSARSVATHHDFVARGAYVSCLSIVHLLAHKPTTLPGEIASPTSASHSGEKPLFR
jgi:hypothetical protein